MSKKKLPSTINKNPKGRTKSNSLVIFKDFRRLTQVSFLGLLHFVKLVLFVINRPPLEPQVEYNKWAKSVAIVSDAATPNKVANKAVTELTLGFWRIDANGGLPFLSLGILECERAELDYAILFLEEKQDFLNFSPETKTTP